MSFVLSIKNAPSGSQWWRAEYCEGYISSGWLGISQPWQCPYAAYGAADVIVSVFDGNSNLKYKSLPFGPIYDGQDYVHDCSQSTLMFPAEASQFRNIMATSVYPAQARVGQRANVNFELEHLGASERVTLYASIGNQGLWFDEILHTEYQYTFPEHSVWTKQYMFAAIDITSAISPGLYDAYAKIKEKNLVSPTLHDCLTVLGNQAEFYNFLIASYQKL